MAESSPLPPPPEVVAKVSAPVAPLHVEEPQSPTIGDLIKQKPGDKEHPDMYPDLSAIGKTIKENEFMKSPVMAKMAEIAGEPTPQQRLSRLREVRDPKLGLGHLDAKEARAVSSFFATELTRVISGAADFGHALDGLRAVPFAERSQDHLQVIHYINGLALDIMARDLAERDRSSGVGILPDGEFAALRHHLIDAYDQGQLADDGISQAHKDNQFKVIQSRMEAVRIVKKESSTPGSTPASNAETPIQTPTDAESIRTQIDALKEQLTAGIKPEGGKFKVTVNGKTVEVDQQGATKIKNILKSDGPRQAFEEVVKLLKQEDQELTDDAEVGKLVDTLIAQVKAMNPGQEIDETKIRQKIMADLAKEKAQSGGLKRNKVMGVAFTALGFLNGMDPVMSAIQAMAGK